MLYKKWEQISAMEYALAYQQYGGSFINNPDILDIISKLTDIQTTYYGYIKEGIITGAIATWGKYVAGDRASIRKHKIDKTIDFGHPDLILPLSSQVELEKPPFKAHSLSSMNETKFMKPKFRAFVRMSIFKYGSELPKSVQSRWNRKLCKFKSMGGELRSIREFSPDEIADLYTRLHQIRWKKSPATSPYLSRNFKALYEYLHGSIVFFNNEPIALHINFAASNTHYLTVDFINGGVIRHFSNLQPGPGTLLFYSNLMSASDEAKAKSLKLRYSFGRSSNPYKDTFCNREFLLKL